MPFEPRPLPFGSIVGVANVSLATTLGVAILFDLIAPDAGPADPWTLGVVTLTTANIILHDRGYHRRVTERWRLPFPRTLAALLFLATC